MTGVPRIHRYTYEQYRILESFSDVKHEFLDGEIYAMAGGTPEHAALPIALSMILGPQLRRGSCRPYSSDLRVIVRATNLATYPDLTIVCGPIEPHPEDRDAVTNPTVLVEVLSPSTQDYDRGVKREHYQQIATLRDLVLVVHDRRQLEHWTRTDDGWTQTVVGPGGTIELASIEATLSVDELYDQAERGA